MNPVLARSFQLAVVLAACGALVFLLVEPVFEGRNAHATLFQVYFNDPFLAFVYVGSIPFFIAAFQLFKVLGFAACHGAFPPTVDASLRRVRACAFAIAGFVAIALAFIMWHESDDRAGGVAMCAIVMLGCGGGGDGGNAAGAQLGRRQKRIPPGEHVPCTSPSRPIRE
jgi:hypothetical protein